MKRRTALLAITLFLSSCGKDVPDTRGLDAETAYQLLEEHAAVYVIEVHTGRRYGLPPSGREVCEQAWTGAGRATINLYVAPRGLCVADAAQVVAEREAGLKASEEAARKAECERLREIARHRGGNKKC